MPSRMCFDEAALAHARRWKGGVPHAFEPNRRVTCVTSDTMLQPDWELPGLQMTWCCRAYRRPARTFPTLNWLGSRCTTSCAGIQRTLQ
jgi:hypothetical protein